MIESFEKPAKDDLAERVENKMEALESNVMNMRKVLEDKDSCINEIHQRLDVLEKKHKEEKEMFENWIKYLDDKKLKLESKN